MKDAGCRRAAQGAPCHFLPSYSLDFNPIEPAFAEIKAYLRRVASRTREALEVEIGHAIDRVTPHHAVNYVRHCGYPPSAL
jgi:transposase